MEKRCDPLKRCVLEVRKIFKSSCSTLGKVDQLHSMVNNIVSYLLKVVFFADAWPGLIIVLR